MEASSYTRIAKEIDQDPARILFVSDNIKGIKNNLWYTHHTYCCIEIQAAKQAGYQVVISDRPGNAPLGPESKEFKIITSFDQIA